MCVAIEGPSNSGKSTLVSALRPSIAGSELEVLPCYVDVAAGRTLPPARGATVDEQLEGLEFFLDLDRERSVGAIGAEGSVLLADRSWLTLVGHTHAIAQCGGPSAFDESLARVEAKAETLFQPDLVLVLSVDPEQLQERTAAADRNEWFADPDYNRAFYEFMATTAPSIFDRPIEVIDGNAAGDQVCALARAAIGRYLG